MKSILINSDHQKTYAKSLIDEMPSLGTYIVDIKQVKESSTAKQRRLQWLWYTEVSQSGLGKNDSKEGVHLTAKWQFARPILLRDDELFGMIYGKFIEVVTGSATYSEFCRAFSDQYISTERMTRKQRAEFLTDFQRFWTGKGVSLTDPATQGLDGFLGGKNGK